MKEREICWARGTAVAADSCFIVLAKPEENEATKEDLGVNVMILKLMSKNGGEGADWIHPAQEEANGGLLRQQ